MSLFECPRCGSEVASNDRVTAFEVPPNLLCIHDKKAVKMKLVTDRNVNEEAIVDE